MVERARNDVTDKVSWRCQQCKGRKTTREGSFFHKSHLVVLGTQPGENWPN